MKSENIIKKTKSAMARAQRKYAQWSGGFWLPEYVATTIIAEDLIKLPEVEFVTLEYHAKDTIEHGGGRKQSRLEKEPRGRIDVTLWDWDGSDYAQPRRLIEVKNIVSDFKRDVQPDVAKLITVHANANTISWSLVAYYLREIDTKLSGAKHRVSRRSDGILKSASAFVESKRGTAIRHKGNIREVEDDDGSWAWTVEVLEILID